MSDVCDRDFDPKDGHYFRVMNEFEDKMCSYKLTSNEHLILHCVIRLTWGMQGRAWAKIGFKKFIEISGLPRSSVGNALNHLNRRNVLHTRKTGKRGTEYKINSKVSTWKNIDRVSGRKMRLVQPVGLTPIKDNIKDNYKDTPIVPTDENDDSGSGSTGKNDQGFRVMTQKEILELDAKTVIDRINELSGKNFKHSESSMTPIIARMKEGYTLDDCLKVCESKWKDPDLKVKYYRPVTLFRKKLFEGYLNETGTRQKPQRGSKAQEIRERKREKWKRRFSSYAK